MERENTIQRLIAIQEQSFRGCGDKCNIDDSNSLSETESKRVRVALAIVRKTLGTSSKLASELNTFVIKHSS